MSIYKNNDTVSVSDDVSHVFVGEKVHASSVLFSARTGR